MQQMGEAWSGGGGGGSTGALMVWGEHTKYCCHKGGGGGGGSRITSLSVLDKLQSTAAVKAAADQQRLQRHCPVAAAAWRVALCAACTMLLGSGGARQVTRALQRSAPLHEWLLRTSEICGGRVAGTCDCASMERAATRLQQGPMPRRARRAAGGNGCGEGGRESQRCSERGAQHAAMQAAAQHSPPAAPPAAMPHTARR